jgi:hypothetical protein
MSAFDSLNFSYGVLAVLSGLCITYMASWIASTAYFHAKWTYHQRLTSFLVKQDQQE